MLKRPEGVPAYGFEGLARLAGLATAGMLNVERREPAPGQKPAGCYWTGHMWAYLWTYADTVAKPPLSPGRQRLYDANRTCRRCAKRSKLPWDKGRDDKRYCPDCLMPAMQELWDAERAAERPGLTAWAREVLADERTVLVAGRPRHYVTELRAETVAGDVLVDALVAYPHVDPTIAERMPEDVRSRAIEVEQAAELLAPLGARRLVSWQPWRDLVAATCGLRELKPGGRGLHDVEALAIDAGDRAGSRYAQWVGKPAGSLLYDPRLAEVPAAFEPADVVEQIRAALAEMATPPPDRADGG